MRFDHIGFLTEDVDKEAEAFTRLFGPMQWSPKITDPLQDVIALFGRTGEGVVYELIQPLSDQSPISASLKSRKNIINHLCYRCEHLTAMSADLRDQGFFPVTEPKPGVAFAGHLVQFFYHPNGMLIEMIEGSVGPFNPP